MNLDISDNEIGTKGASLFADVLKRSMSLRTLNISGTGIRSKGALLILDSLPQSLSTLIMDRNFGAAGDAAKMAQKLGTLWATHPGLSAISIVGDEKYRMKESLVPFLNELAKNDALTELDISSNGIGDVGFAALATAMRSNCKLKYLKSDGNKVSFSGFQALRTALLYNSAHALESWEWPISDAKSASPSLLGVLNDIFAVIHRKGNMLSTTKRPENPLNFARDWSTPGKPSSLPDVPQYLKEHSSSVETLQQMAAATSSNDGSASPRAPSEIPPTPPAATLRPTRNVEEEPSDSPGRGRRRSHSTAFEKPPPGLGDPPSPPPPKGVVTAPRPPPVAERSSPQIPPPPTNRPPPPTGPPPPTNRPPPMTAAAPAPPPPPPVSAAPPPPPPPPAAPPAPKPPGPPPPPTPPSSEGRGDLLNSITGFKGGLKKVKTNDRSSPQV